jgi:hypothetical protein
MTTPAPPPATIPGHSEGELAAVSLDASSSLEIDRPAPASGTAADEAAAHPPRPPSLPTYLRHASLLI